MLSEKDSHVFSGEAGCFREKEKGHLITNPYQMPSVLLSSGVYYMPNFALTKGVASSALGLTNNTFA